MPFVQEAAAVVINTSGGTATINGVTAGNAIVLAITGTSSGSRSFNPTSDIDGAYDWGIDDDAGTSRVSAIFVWFNVTGGNHTFDLGWTAGISVNAKLVEFSGLEGNPANCFGRQYVEPLNTNAHQMVDPTAPINTSVAALFFGCASLNSTTGDQTTTGTYTELSTLGNQHFYHYKEESGAISSEYGTWTGSGSARLGNSTLVVLPLASTGTTGTVAISGKLPTTAVAGRSVHTGTVGISGKRPTTAIAGTPRQSFWGTVIGHLPTADVNGAPVITGAVTIAGKLPLVDAEQTLGTITGTVAIAGKLPTTDADGRTYHATSVAAAAKLPTVDVNGAPVVRGAVAIAGKLPVVDAEWTVDPITGDVDAVAALPTVDVVGTPRVTGAVAIAGKLPLVDAEWTVDPLTGTVNALAALPALDVAGAPLATGAVEIAAPSVSAAAAGGTVHTGTVAAVARLPLVHATQELENPTGTVDAQAPRVTTAASGRSLVVGTVSVDAPSAQADVATFVPVQGVVDVAASLPRVDALGTIPAQASVGASAALPQVDVITSLPVVGAVDVTAPSAIASALGEGTDLAGTVDAVAPAADVTAQGTIPVVGAVAVQAALPAADVVGVLPVTGTASAESAAAVVTSAGISSIAGSVTAVAPLPTTTILYFSGIVGTVSAYAPLPTVESRNFERTWYLMVREDQPPFDADNDAAGMRQYKFNITAHKQTSPAFEEEIAEYLQHEFPAYGKVLIGAGSTVPKGAGPYVILIKTGGIMGLGAQGSPYAHIDRVSLQVVVKAKTTKAAKNAAYHIHRRLSAITNRYLVVPAWANVSDPPTPSSDPISAIGTTWYQLVRGNTPPYESDNDPAGWRQYKFDITAHKSASDTFEEELAAFLEQQFPTYGKVIVGAGGSAPTGDGPFITLIGSGGITAMRSQNSANPSIERLGATVVVRAKTTSAAKLAAYYVHNRLSSISNQELAVPTWAGS